MVALEGVPGLYDFIRRRETVWRETEHRVSYTAASITRDVLKSIFLSEPMIGHDGVTYVDLSGQQTLTWGPGEWKDKFFAPALMAVEWTFHHQQNPDMVRSLIAEVAARLPKFDPTEPIPPEGFFGAGVDPSSVQLSTQIALDVFPQFVAPLATMYEFSYFPGTKGLPEHHMSVSPGAQERRRLSRTSVSRPVHVTECLSIVGGKIQMSYLSCQMHSDHCGVV